MEEIFIACREININAELCNPFESSGSCRYAKSQWSECDSKTNQRTRTLTLKRGEQGCVQTRTIQKKCKKGNL